MSLETAKRKREWRDHAIAQFTERKAKKAKHESTYLDGPQTKPGNSSTIPNGPQTRPGNPSTTPTTQTPGASSSFADEPMDLEVELGLAEAEVVMCRAWPQALRPWPTGPHKPGPSQAHSRAY